MLQSADFGVYLLCFVFISISFYFFSAVNIDCFNSDQAVQVLMIKNFQWPADSYYWGQNRLGSLLPLISSFFYSFIKIHPIILVSIINYMMLVIGWFIFSKYLKSNWAKLLFCIAVFFPHPTYFFIILIGHPYQGQFFTLALATLFLNDLFNKITTFEKWNWKEYLKLFFTVFTSILAVWVSELSLVYYVFVLFYILFNKKVRNHLFSAAFLKSKLIFPVINTVILLLIGILLILDLKHGFEKDPVYDQFFISNFPDIELQFHYFYIQFKDVLLLQNHYTIFECLFYYSITIGLLIVIFNLKNNDYSDSILFKTLGLTFIVAIILLFFSSWNYRSKFDPKYFNLLYALIWVLMGIGFSNMSQLKQFAMFILLCIPLLYSNLQYLKNTYQTQSVFEKYMEVSKLPKGTLVADYWKAYKIAAIGFDSIDGVSKNFWDCRNIHKYKQWSKNENFYFIKNELFEYEKRNDTLCFRGLIFKPTNTFYKIDIDTFLLYKNVSKSVK